MSKKKCSVLIINGSKNFNPSNRFSAVASVVYSLSELLHDNGHEVYINDSPFSELISLNLDAQKFTSAKPSPIAKFIPKGLKRFLKEILIFKGIKNLYQRLFHGKQADIIIEFQSFGCSIGAQLSKQWKVPLIYMFDAPQVEEHAFLNGNNPILKKYFQAAETESLKAAHSIMFYSPSVREYACKLDNSIKEKDFFYHQLVDFKRLNFIEREKYPEALRLGYIGSFLKWHKLDTLLAIYKQLTDEGHLIKLEFIGIGEEFESIKEIASTCSGKENIRFHGFLDGPKLAEVINEIDIGLIPNAMWFHAPVKLFQYGASKMVTLAAKTPTIEFISKGNQGALLFEVGSREELYHQIKKLSEDKTQLENLANANQQFIKTHYNKEKVYSLFESKIDQLLQSN